MRIIIISGPVLVALSKAVRLAVSEFDNFSRDLERLEIAALSGFDAATALSERLNSLDLYVDYYDPQERLFNQMQSIIQSQRYSPSVIKGSSSVGYYRKTSFCNKKLHCKRKRRKQL